MSDFLYLGLAFALGCGLTYWVVQKRRDPRVFPTETPADPTPAAPQVLPIPETPADVAELAEGLCSELADLATGIGGHSELLCDAIGNPALVASQAQSLWVSVRKLRLFSEKVLSSRRIPGVRRVPTDVRELLSALRQELEDYSGAGLRVECDAASSLPLAVADPDALRKTILFLVDSLLDLETDAGRLVLRASTAVCDEFAPRVDIEIRVESEDAPLPTPSDSKPWAMGCTAARNLTTSLGGELTLEHIPGLCSTAHIVLEAAPANAATPEPAKPLVKGDPHPFGGILIVEDDPGVRTLIAREMEKTGRRVFPCADGIAARSLFTATPERFELLILDAEARRQPGIQLAAEALSRCPDLKILLLGTEPERTLRGLDLGAVHGELHKPFGIAQLREAVYSLLEPSDVQSLPA